MPHGIAKALAVGSSRIVVLNVDSALEGNYSRSFIKGLDLELAEHDHVLLVRHGHVSQESTRQVLDAIAPRAVLQFAGVYREGEGLNDTGGGWKDGLAAHSALQIGHLVERGHTSIAFALPERDTPLARARLRFARETASKLGVAPVTPFTVPRPRQDGTRAVETFLAAHATTTAAAALDDDVALRILAALHDLDLEAPDDLAVMGYDDTESGALSTPSLTTVHIDAEAHGRVAARTALGLDPSGITRVAGHVVIRESA